MISAKEALERLQTGNRRFVSTESRSEASTDAKHRHDLVAGQRPFAIILGCSDSRVPAELVFDQGFGDLFVIRVAGNVAAPSQVGSVEFAVQKFATPLVVVLGHSHCGAIAATLDELEQPSENSPNLDSIVARIKPAVASLMETPLVNDREALVQQATRANVRLAADQLRQDSRLLEQLVRQEKLLVVGAEYSLETGEVDFFDGMPE